MADVSVLDREMYSEAEAARLLGVAQSTLNYWLEGGVRRGKSYRPIIRTEPTGSRNPVTWAEFVEAGLLRSYRRDLGVRMAQLREFIDLLRTDFDVPYPLADRRPPGQRPGSRIRSAGTKQTGSRVLDREQRRRPTPAVAAR